MNRLNRRKERLLNEIAERISQMLLSEEKEREWPDSVQVYGTNQMKGNLSGEDIRGMDFSGIRFEGVTFDKKQDLRGADFRGANLKDTVNFVEALIYTGALIKGSQNLDFIDVITSGIKNMRNTGLFGGDDYKIHRQKAETYIRAALSGSGSESIKFDSRTTFPALMEKVFTNSIFKKSVGKLSSGGGYNMKKDSRF